MFRRLLHDRKLPSVTGKYIPILRINDKQKLKKDYLSASKNHNTKSNLYGYYKNLNEVIKARKKQG